MVDPRNSRRQKSRRRARRALILPDPSGRFEPLEPRLLMATHIWTGASSDTNNWTDAANWLGNTAPTAGDDLDFPVGVTNKTTNNNFTAGTNFGSIEIDDSGYTLGGNGIHLGGSLIATYTSGTSTISADLGLAACTVNVASGGNLALTGNLTDRDVDTIGGVTKEGIGTLALSGNNSYSDATTIEAGTILVESDTALGSTAGGTTVEAGAVLALGGDVSVTEDISIAGSGISTGGAIDNLSGTNTLNWGVTLNSNAAIGVSAGALTISGAIGGGANTLTKVGAGILDLAGTNTYTGTTTVDDGTLLVDGTVDGDVTVTSGTLGGTGSINGTAVNVDGGHLNPGPVGGTGALSVIPHVGTDVSFSSSSTFDVDIDGASAYDSIVFPNMFGGVVKISPNDATLAVHLGYLPSVGDSFTIVSASGVGGTLNVPSTFNGLAGGATFDEIYNGVDLTFQIAYQPSGIVLTVTHETYTWSGLGGDANWSTGANWVGGTAPTPGAGVSLLFPAAAARQTNHDDLGGGSDFDNITINASGYDIGGDSIKLNGDIIAGFALGTSSISDDIALQSTRTITVPGGGTLNLSGALSGMGYGITKDGGGTLEFSGTAANTYSYTTTVNAGTLVLAKSDGVISANGSVIVGDNTTAATLQLGGSDQFWVGADVTVNEGSTFDVGTHSAHISNLNLGGSTVQIDSGGVLATFVGVNTTDPTNDVTSLIQGQGALQIDNTWNTFTIAADPNLDVDLSISTIVQGLSASSGFHKEGAGALALSGANTYGGNTWVDAGTLIAESDTALGAAAATAHVSSGASLRLEGVSLSIANALSIAGDGVDGHGALSNLAGSATVSGDITLADAARVGTADATILDLTGNINDYGEHYLLTVDGRSTGTVVLDANNPTTGGITVAGGILKATQDDSLGDAGTSSTVTLESGATLELSGGISTPATKSLVVQGAGANAGADDQIINASGDNTFGGGIQLQANSSVSVANATTLTLSGDISESGGSRAFTEDGAGTLVITGTGSYTGDTNINGGTMQVDGDISASDALYINPGATLAGTGTVPATNAGGGGTVAPGDGGPGALSTGGFGMSPNSAATFDIDGPTAGSGYSQIVVSGTNSIVIDSANLSLNLGYTPAIGTQFTLISNGTGQAIIGSFGNVIAGQPYTDGNVTYTVTYAGGADGRDVVLTVTDVTYTWSGADVASGDWSLGDNWVGGLAPTPGARLIFPSGASRMSNVNDLPANFSVYEIDFQASGYAVSGHAIDLSNGIFTTYTTGSVDFELDAELEQATATVALAGGSLLLDGAITQPMYQYRTLHATGSGTLTLGGTGNNAFAHLQADGPDVVLDKNSGYAIWAEGDFTDGSTLTLAADGQFGTNTYLKLYEGTTFNLAGFDAIVYGLELEGATVLVPTGSTLTLTYEVSAYDATNDVTSQITGAGTIDLNGSDLGFYIDEDAGAGVTLSIDTVMTDGGITKDNAGSLALAASNTFDGDVHVLNGTLIVRDASALGSAVGSTTVDNGATLELDSAGSIAEPITLGMCGSGATLVNASGDNHLTGAVTLVGDSTIEVDGGSLAIDGQVSGTGGFTMTGTGELTLTASNTYSGATMISAGTLDITNSGALSTSAVTVLNGATLQLDGGITITPSSITVGGGPGAVGTGGLLSATGDNAYAGPLTLGSVQSMFGVSAGSTLDLSGDIGESGSARQLNKIGGGTLVLGGTGSYSGGVSLQSGTTILRGSIAASPQGAAVYSGATLGGDGTVGPTLFGMSGGTVAPGDNGPGVLTVAGVDLALDAIYGAEIDGTAVGTGYSQLQVNGTVTLGGATLSLSIGNSFRAAAGDTFTLINNDGVDPVSGTFTKLPEGTVFAADGQAFQISYTGGDGNDVVLVAVPISVSPTTLVSPAVGSAYSEQLTASGGSGSGYTFSATGLPAGLSIGASGLITGTPTTATGTPVTVHVTVTDSIDSTTTQDVTITVNPAISATPTTLVAPTAGSVYSQQLTGIGGSGSGYTFSSTDLPAGLSIGGTGLIGGTPTTASSTPVTFHVSITDGNGMVAVQTYSTTINQPLAVTPATPTPPAVGSAYSLQVGATGGSGSGYTFSATGLPAGLSIGASGLITGTPTGNGGSPYTVQVTITDGQGASATLPLTLAVDDALAITPSTVPSPAVGTPYSQQLTGSGGSGSGYTFSATGLPTGLSINASGLISGTPTTVTGSPFSVMVTITDGDGNSRAIPFTVTTVAGASTTTLASSANPAIVGQAFTLTATISAFQAGSVLPDGGTVTFLDGTTVLGTASVVNGTAQLQVATLTFGPHSLTASFSGSADFQSSVSSAFDLTSQFAGISTFIVAGTGSTASPPITLTLAVASQQGHVPTGLVQFFEDGGLMGTASLNDGGTATFTTTTIAAGSHAFTATYAGDALFAGSTSTQSFAVGKAQTQNGDVASSAPQVFYGQQVSLTATFTASYNGTDAMTGTVAFYDGTTFLGTATLGSSPPVGPAVAFGVSPAASPAVVDPTQITGQAILPNVTLAVGQHVIQAVYSGNASYAGVTSVTPVSVAVQPATTGTQLAVGSGAAGATTLTATIVPTSPGTPTLTGTVSFYDGDTLLGTAPVSNRVATFNAGVLSAGPHAFRAVFSGGAEATSSGSSTVIYTPVANGPTVVSIRRYGRHFQPTYVVLSFSGALDPARAEDVRNYQLLKLNSRGKPMGGPILIKRAQLDPVSHTVTLSFAHRLSIYRHFRVTVFGSSASGVAGATGQPLNASPTRASGDNFVGVMTQKNFSGPARVLPTTGATS